MIKKSILENDQLITESFSKDYLKLTKQVDLFGEEVPSRNGDTLEILNFKTKLINPYNRLVGGFERCVNPFFLMAEAIWIVAGRRDLETMQIFNEGMKQYSDNGTDFHAAYGYRMKDQIPETIKMLSENSLDRRAVISIWDKDLDLNKNTKDIPCNDLLMLKIRDGKLHSTIANRSNDLHWGLTTNVYQFSFLTECISECLEISLGTQTHNSQSLHVYKDLQLHKDLMDFSSKHGTTFGNLITYNFYDEFETSRFNFDFASVKNPDLRWGNLVVTCNEICNFLCNSDVTSINYSLQYLEHFSKTLFNMFSLTLFYKYYKKSKQTKTMFLQNVLELIKQDDNIRNVDFFVLSVNWILSKMQTSERNTFIENSTYSIYLLEILNRKL